MKDWYGQGDYTLEMVSSTAVWYHTGMSMDRIHSYPPRFRHLIHIWGLGIGNQVNGKEGLFVTSRIIQGYFLCLRSGYLRNGDTALQTEYRARPALIIENGSGRLTDLMLVRGHRIFFIYCFLGLLPDCFLSRSHNQTDCSAPN